jgi:Ca-activated chloride channel family protein
MAMAAASTAGQIIFSPQLVATFPWSLLACARQHPPNGNRGHKPNSRKAEMTTAINQPRRLVVVDFIAFIVLALGVGVTAGIVLGGLVLLFSGNAAAAELERLPTVATRLNEAQQGSLLLKAKDGTYAVPVLATDVVIRVSGIIARAQVRQIFRNPSDDWQEGIYVFPLPENAAVDHLKMKIGERIIDGEVKEKAAAKAAFDQAKGNGQRAALVEQERPNIFTTSVANIPPKGEIVVQIEYQQTLRYDSGHFILRFPMVVGPRYIPGTPDGTSGSGWAGNTDQVPDAARITPPVTKPTETTRPINPVHIKVTLDAGVPLERIDSPYHAVNVARPDDRSAEVELADGAVPANKDFELSWTPAASLAPQAALFTEPGKDATYGLLMLLPPTVAAQARRMPREVIYVIDTSGSMTGTSIGQAKEAVEMAVARLSGNDRFNIIEFNSSASPLFAEARPATADNLRRATDFVRGLKPRGGTEMAAALNLALNGKEDGQRVRQVVFLTDGSVGNEDALFRLIEQKLGDSRLFTVGIGSAPNSFFMTKAAQAGRGTFTYIGRIEEVKEKMAALFAKLESPVVKGVRIDWPGKAEAWPARVPDLYLGEPVVVSVALDKDVNGKVRVSGLRGDAPWQSDLSLAQAEHGSGLGALWARSKIESLLDSLRQGTKEEDVRSQVVDVALEHHLVSKYTSLVAVDKTPVRSADAALKGGALPANLPEGWDHAAVFGELPKGAADTTWHLLLGLVAALLAAGLFFAGRRPTFA